MQVSNIITTLRNTSFAPSSIGGLCVIVMGGQGNDALCALLQDLQQNGGVIHITGTATQPPTVNTTEEDPMQAPLPDNWSEENVQQLMMLHQQPIVTAANEEEEEGEEEMQVSVEMEDGQLSDDPDGVDGKEIGVNRPIVQTITAPTTTYHGPNLLTPTAIGMSEKQEMLQPASAEHLEAALRGGSRRSKITSKTQPRRLDFDTTLWRFSNKPKIHLNLSPFSQSKSR